MDGGAQSHNRRTNHRLLEYVFVYNIKEANPEECVFFFFFNSPLKLVAVGLIGLVEFKRNGEMKRRRFRPLFSIVICFFSNKQTNKEKRRVNGFER